MAKRQPTKRTIRPKKTESAPLMLQAPEPPPPPTESAPIVRAPEAGSAQPERRNNLTLFTFTLIAALLGVALGYYLGAEAIGDREEDESFQAGTPARIDSNRGREVLVFLQDELVENARILKQQRELRQGGNVDPSVRFQFVKNDLWRAVVNGGDIQAVQDLNLLNTIATAYRYIDELRLLERRSIEATSISGTSVPGAREQQSAISSSLNKLAPLAEKSILEAVVQLDQKLKVKQ